MPLGKVRRFFRNCFQRDDIERDLDDELRAHVELLTELGKVVVAKDSTTNTDLDSQMKYSALVIDKE